MSQFVHLHLHTDYSMLDGACDVEKLVDRVDFFGPTSNATSKWATDRYPVDRLVIANRGVFGRCLVGAYRHAWPLVHKIVGAPGARAHSARARQTPGVADC